MSETYVMSPNGSVIPTVRWPSMTGRPAMWVSGKLGFLSGSVRLLKLGHGITQSESRLSIVASVRGACTHLPVRAIAPVVYAFPKVGVQSLRAAYRALLAYLGGVDAVVLVDGGTGILLRGDESSLRTPEEDITSLAAVHGLHRGEAPQRIVACLGFGIDYYHRVNHALVLENLAHLRRAGAYLGAFDIPAGSREEAAYLDAVAHAQAATPGRPSIVNGQIAAALRGEFGDAQFTRRTAGSELFINPLMSVYFTVDLDGLAAANQYLVRIEDTVLMRQVSARIEVFREELPKRRPPRQYPR